MAEICRTSPAGSQGRGAMRSAVATSPCLSCNFVAAARISWPLRPGGW